MDLGDIWLIDCKINGMLTLHGISIQYDRPLTEDNYRDKKQKKAATNFFPEIFIASNESKHRHLVFHLQGLSVTNK